MTTQIPRSRHEYEINAILWVSEDSEERIKAFLLENFGVKKNRLQSRLHLTVYHGRRPLPRLRQRSETVSITANTAETRFMILKPGGENPRDSLEPRENPIGVRLTRRNQAIPEIQKLREQIYRLETKWVTGTRKSTTAWTNCFGSRHYQPHIQFLREWHKIEESLTEIGSLFRVQVEHIDFDQFQIEIRHRVNGKWVTDSLESYDL